MNFSPSRKIFQLPFFLGVVFLAFLFPAASAKGASSPTLSVNPTSGVPFEAVTLTYSLPPGSTCPVAVSTSVVFDVTPPSSNQSQLGTQQCSANTMSFNLSVPGTILSNAGTYQFEAHLASPSGQTVAGTSATTSYLVSKSQATTTTQIPPTTQSTTSQTTTSQSTTSQAPLPTTVVTTLPIPTTATSAINSTPSPKPRHPSRVATQNTSNSAKNDNYWIWIALVAGLVFGAVAAMLFRNRGDRPKVSSSRYFNYDGKKLPAIFSTWNESDIAKLLEFANFVSYKSGATFSLCDQNLPKIVILTKGTLEYEGTLFHEGALIGVSNYFNGGNQDIFLKAINDCEVVSFKKSDIDKFSVYEPYLGRAFLFELGRFLSFKLEEEGVNL